VALDIYVRALPAAIRSAVGVIANATRRSERLELAAGPHVDSDRLLEARVTGSPPIAHHTTPGIPEHNVPEVALVTAGVEYDVLAGKLPGYVPSNFCAIIRRSKPST
jgi:hypothetical protein